MDTTARRGRHVKDESPRVELQKPKAAAPAPARLLSQELPPLESSLDAETNTKVSFAVDKEYSLFLIKISRASDGLTKTVYADLDAALPHLMAATLDASNALEAMKVAKAMTQEQADG